MEHLNNEKLLSPTFINLYHLLLIKPDNVKEVHNSLNKFDKNLCLTVDMFQNKVPCFLDLELSPDGI